jgi:hypothetical protein
LPRDSIARIRPIRAAGLPGPPPPATVTASPAAAAALVGGGLARVPGTRASVVAARGRFSLPAGAPS